MFFHIALATLRLSTSKRERDKNMQMYQRKKKLFPPKCSSKKTVIRFKHFCYKGETKKYNKNKKHSLPSPMDGNGSNPIDRTIH